ncbi:MAG: glycoside hydrolase family 3 N-terminal domain-containing protein, partial [Bacteroidia bacterium]
MNTSAKLPNRITALLSELSLAEKVGQMTQLTITSLIEMNGEQAIRPIRFKKDAMKEDFGTYKIGSILNVPSAGIGPEEWKEMIANIQEYAKEYGTHIPVLYGVDSIHGASYTYGATFFPQQIGMAATRNRELVEELGTVSAYETRASGIPWNFSPVVDIARNPLWPRIWEGFGEDVHLCSTLGVSLTKGYQGEDIGDPTRVAACLKHYLGYGQPLSGMDRTPAWIPERFLREYYLPPFKAAIDAGAATIMINSGEINGIPVHADPFILTDILRGELGFEGVAVTDWQDIIYLHVTHRTTHNNRESVKKAVLAGIDMSMVPWDFSFSKDLISLVNDGEISMDRIDEAVGRIIKLKADLGLLDETPTFNYEKFGSAEHHAAAIACAQESITLLKNDGILPLPHSKKILITGMASDSVKVLNGGWSHTWQGHDSSVDNPHGKSILSAFQELMGSENISFAQGTFFDEESDVQAAID